MVKRWIAIITMVSILLLIIAGGVCIIRDEYNNVQKVKVSSNEYTVVGKRIDKNLFGRESYIVSFEWLNQVNRDITCDYDCYKNLAIGDTIWIDITVDKDCHILDMKVKENQNETMVNDKIGNQTSSTSSRVGDY